MGSVSMSDHVNTINDEIKKIRDNLNQQKRNFSDFLLNNDKEKNLELYNDLLLVESKYQVAIDQLNKIESDFFYFSSFMKVNVEVGRKVNDLEVVVKEFFSQDYIYNKLGDQQLYIEDQWIVIIKIGLESINSILLNVKPEINILDKIVELEVEDENTKSKLNRLETVFESLKNEKIELIFNDDSEKFNKLARKYEISFYFVVVFMILYFLGVGLYIKNIDLFLFEIGFPSTKNVDINIEFYIKKISLLILTTTLAAFLLKRSFMNRYLADEAYRTAKELDALPRYIEGLPIEMKEKIRFDLVYKYFGNQCQQENYKNGENLIIEHIKANTEFLKSLKGIQDETKTKN